MDRQLLPRVLAIGNCAHADFAAARALLRRETRIGFVPNAEYAAAWLSANPPVAWVMLFQARPYELPREIVDRLRPLVGAAKFVSVLGSWCEGELRTGRPWPHVQRVYWHAFPSWWPANAQQSKGGRLGHIAISAVDYSTAKTLIDALASEGWGAAWWPRHAAMPLATRISAGIWVGGQLSGSEAVRLDSFCRRMRQERTPVVALLDFPRVDRVDLAKRIGVSEVLGKPWQIDELSTTLHHLIDAHSFSTERRLTIQSA